MTCETARWLVRPGRNGPITRSRIVHRIMEPGGRDRLAFGQCLQHCMHDRAIAVRRCEYAANATRRQIGHVVRLLSNRQCQPNRCADTASFVGRENTGRRRQCFPPYVLPQSGEDRTAARPTIESRTAYRYGVDESLDHRTVPNTRLQLMPPKPNALLITVRTGRSSLCKTTRE